jgi:hypothetical protein
VKNLTPQYFITQRRDDTREESDHNLKLNLDYALNAKNAFNFEAIGNKTGEINNETLKSLTQTQTRSFTSNNSRFSKEIVNEKGLELAMGYKHKFEDSRKSLSANASSSLEEQREDTDISTQTLNEQNAVKGNPFLQQTYFDNKMNISNVQLDYAQPISEKGVLEMGLKHILRDLTSDFQSSDKINDAFEIVG